MPLPLLATCSMNYFPTLSPKAATSWPLMACDQHDEGSLLSHLRAGLRVAATQRTKRPCTSLTDKPRAHSKRLACFVPLHLKVEELACGPPSLEGREDANRGSHTRRPKSLCRSRRDSFPT